MRNLGKISDGRKLEKNSYVFNLNKNSATDSCDPEKNSDMRNLGKISDGRKLGKNSNVFNLKKKSATDSCDPEKNSDMRNVGKILQVSYKVHNEGKCLKKFSENNFSFRLSLDRFH